MVVHASMFSYYPIVINLQQVSPPITLDVINTEGSTGVNKTSAVVNITASNSEQSLITNTGFDSGADSWYYASDGKLVPAWINSDGIAQGLILVYNATDVSQITDSILYLYQNFTVPESVSSVNYMIRYRLAREPIIYDTYLYLGIYDWESGSVTWFINQQLVSTSNSYTTSSGSASVSLVPGKTYAVLIGVELYQVYYWSPDDFYFLIDAVNITYAPSVERFSNDVIGIKTDGNYYVKLIIDNITGGNNLNINLTLHSQYGSSTISINNGVPNSTETTWVPVEYGGNPLYYDGKIKADVVSYTTGTSITIKGRIEYKPFNGGVTVYYPVVFNIKG